MMDLKQMDVRVRSSFGSAARLNTRRPGKLYQLEVPAYLSDGDAAFIFIEPLAADRIRMTDLGHTSMRLSYTRKLTPAVLEHLDRLATRHGFHVSDGDISSEFAPEEIAAGAFGLLQVQSEAEAAIASAVSRAERGETFRSTVRKALRDVFGDGCQLDYRAANDPDGLFTVDAMVSTRRRFAIAITPTALYAEKAIGTKGHVERVAAEAGALWIAIPRDINELDSGTRLRLMSEFLAPIPRYEDASQLEPKLRELAG